MVASLSGEIIPTAFSEPTVVAQKLFGIRDIRPIKKNIELTANTIRDEIRKVLHPDVIGHNVYRVKAYRDQERFVTERVEKLIGGLKEKEVAFVSLNIEKGFLKRADLDQSPEGFRQGVSALNGYSAEHLRDLIYPPEKKEEKADGG